jgi:hypothetical protein
MPCYYPESASWTKREEEHQNESTENMTLWSLSWPVMIEMFLQFAIGTADTLMVSRISDDAVAVVGFANQFFNAVMILLMLVASGAGILIAQRMGARYRLNKAAGRYIYEYCWRRNAANRLKCLISTLGDMRTNLSAILNILWDKPGIMEVYTVGSFVGCKNVTKCQLSTIHQFIDAHHSYIIWTGRARMFESRRNHTC